MTLLTVRTVPVSVEVRREDVVFPDGVWDGECLRVFSSDTEQTEVEGPGTVGDSY